jgi:hypothetical protein
MACNYYQIINYNSVEDGYYRYTGCTSVVSVGTITPLNTEFVCAEDLIQESYSGPLSITNIGLCPTATPTPSIQTACLMEQPLDLQAVVLMQL